MTTARRLSMSEGLRKIAHTPIGNGDRHHTTAFNAMFSAAMVASFGLYGASAIGFAVGNIVAAGIAIGVSRLLTPKISVPTSEIQAVISETAQPRRVFVGKNLAGGVRAFFHTKDGTLYQLVVVGHGRINSFVEFWIDGEPMGTALKPPGGGGFAEWIWDFAQSVTDKATYLTIATRDGSGQGGNYQMLRDAFPETWTAAHRLDGQASFLVAAKAPPGEIFSKVFPKASQTTYQWVIEGQRIRDPRSNTTAYSDNAALVIAHYLTHADGFRLASSEVDWDSVRAMADVSDLPIPQKAGGTAPNLRLWGHWTLDEAPIDVLDRMHASSGIRAYETQDGKIGLIGGNYGTPACTITARDISSITTKEAINEREGYNVLIPFFMSEAQKFVLTEVEAWRDEARLAQEGEISTEYKLEMCPNQSQARRLAKKQIHDDNRATVEIVTNLVGLKARYPRYLGQRHTILLDYRPEDGSGREIVGEYEVMNHQFDPINLECRIELAKVDRASETWTPAEEGELIVAPAGPGNDPPPDIVAVLTQVVMRPNERTGLAWLQVEAAPIPDRDDIRIQARYRKVGDTAWINMEATKLVARSGIVQDRQKYEAQARFQGVFAGVDDWEPLGPITITVDANPPGQPTELIPSPSGGAVHLSWRNPNGAFAEIRIYRGTTTNPANASLVGATGGVSGQISEYRDETVSPATQYRYWVAAANASGIEGDWTGPATITTP